jgi:hypothetical protein
LGGHTKKACELKFHFAPGCFRQWQCPLAIVPVTRFGPPIRQSDERNETPVPQNYWAWRAKRVNRAVERLREFFAKRGVTVGASGLVVVISANAVQAAPAGLAGTLSTAAVLAGTTLTTTATATAAKIIAMTALQKTLIATVLAAAVGAGIYTVLDSKEERPDPVTLLKTIIQARQRIASGEMEFEVAQSHAKRPLDDTNQVLLKVVFDGSKRR